MARFPKISLSAAIAILSVVVIAVIVGGYSVYWFRLADAVAVGVAEWTADQRARGYRVDYRDLEVTGFPGRLRLGASAPAFGRPAADPPWLWSGPTLAAELAPWAPRRVTIRIPGAHRLDAVSGGQRRTIAVEAAGAVIELVLDRRGRIGDAALRSSGLTAAVVETGERISIAKLDIAVHPRSPVEATVDGIAAAGADVEIAVEKLILPPHPPNPLGSEIARLVGQIDLLGPLPIDGTAAAAKAWRDAAGRLDVRRLTLHWGTLEIEASGRLDLDAKLQPRGEFESAIRGWGGILGALVAAGRMNRLAATAAGVLLGALARPAADGGSPILPTTIGLRDRRVYLGPVRILKLPPLIWRQPPDRSWLDLYSTSMASTRLP